MIESVNRYLLDIFYLSCINTKWLIWKSVGRLSFSVISSLILILILILIVCMCHDDRCKINSCVSDSFYLHIWLCFGLSALFFFLRSILLSIYTVNATECAQMAWHHHLFESNNYWQSLCSEEKVCTDIVWECFYN